MFHNKDNKKFIVQHAVYKMMMSKICRNNNLLIELDCQSVGLNYDTFEKSRDGSNLSTVSHLLNLD